MWYREREWDIIIPENDREWEWPQMWWIPQQIHKFWEAAATQHSHSNVEVASSVLQHHNEEKSLGAAHWMFTQNE